MKKLINIWKKNKNNLLNKYKLEKYTLYGKAFPGRASILINLLKLNQEHIECIFEKNQSKKNYHYAPGTNIPIFPDRKILNKIDNKKKYIFINFAWHISKEIKLYMSKYKVKKIIDIVQKSDFKSNS